MDIDEQGTTEKSYRSPGRTIRSGKSYQYWKELSESERSISMKKNYLYLEELSASERIIRVGKSYQCERISINKNFQYRKDM